MAKLVDRLNSSTKPKRQPSFHADQPRKAKLRAMKNVAGANPSSKPQPVKMQSPCLKTTPDGSVDLDSTVEVSTVS